MGSKGAKKFGQKTSDFTDNRGFLAYCRRTSSYNQRPTYIKFWSCNCSIHDFAFQDRPS
jgi:hypothetical protein